MTIILVRDDHKTLPLSRIMEAAGCETMGDLVDMTTPPAKNGFLWHMQGLLHFIPTSVLRNVLSLQQDYVTGEWKQKAPAKMDEIRWDQTRAVVGPVKDWLLQCP